MTTIYVVDDDRSVRRALKRLIETTGRSVREFASAHEFLEAPKLNSPACLVLDIRMEGLDGMGLQEHLANTDRPLPIIFITGHGDIPTTVRAMKGGALDFLPKPVEDEQLLLAIEEALSKDYEFGSKRFD